MLVTCDDYECSAGTLDVGERGTSCTTATDLSSCTDALCCVAAGERCVSPDLRATSHNIRSCVALRSRWVCLCEHYPDSAVGVGVLARALSVIDVDYIVPLKIT